MNIYLIGMPLSGKTTIGKLLADKLNYNHLDLDHFIETKYNVKIDKLFKENKETQFRNLETKALKACLNISNTVVSTGGGIVEDELHKDLMKGPIVLLDVKLETLEKRQMNAKKRPLLKTISLLDIYKRRKNKYYRFADIIIIEENKNRIVTEIINKLKEKNFI